MLQLPSDLQKKSDRSGPPKRIQAIDILRALALILVLGRHMIPCPQETSTLWHYISILWIRGGWIGVDIFFVLSGFLVSGLLFHEYTVFGDISRKNFLIRRGFKIYPPFWMMLIITTIFIVAFGNDIKWNELISEALFIQNYRQGIWNHTWSLAVEEHFYILLLIIVWFLSKKTNSERPFHQIPKVFIALALATLTLRIITTLAYPFSSKIHVFPTHLRIDSLFFGVFLSYLFHFHTARFLEFSKRYAKLMVALATPILLVPFIVPLSSPYFTTIGFTMLSLASGGLLCAMLTLDLPERRIFFLVSKIGSHSYSIYLWHIPVSTMVLPYLFKDLKYPNWFLWFTLYITLSCVIGVIITRCIEFPILAYRNRHFPARRLKSKPS
jgi:peptidoglycan/LPS O-acetylase OafA/YrhL